MFLHFGKYEGRHISDVPLGYLQWAAKEAECLTWLQRRTIESEIARRGQAQPRKPPPESARSQTVVDVEALKANLQRWYHTEAREHHPDAGGDAKVFIALKRAFERLKVMLGVHS